MEGAGGFFDELEGLEEGLGDFLDAGFEVEVLFFLVVFLFLLRNICIYLKLVLYFRSYYEVDIEEGEKVLTPLGFIGPGGDEMLDEGSPVDQVVLENGGAAVVTHHEVEAGQELLELALLVGLLFGLVKTIGIPQNVLYFRDEIFSPLHVKGLMLFFVKIFLEVIKCSLTFKINHHESI